MKYWKGLKYQLAETYICQTPIIGERIEDDFFTLQEDGTLIVNKGFAWDGASGPTFDSRSSMRPSLVHDVFCQAMRDGRLSYEQWQDKVNDLSSRCAERMAWGLACESVAFRCGTGGLRESLSRGRIEKY